MTNCASATTNCASALTNCANATTKCVMTLAGFQTDSSIRIIERANFEGVATNSVHNRGRGGSVGTYFALESYNVRTESKRRTLRRHRLFRRTRLRRVRRRQRADRQRISRIRHTLRRPARATHPVDRQHNRRDRLRSGNHPRNGLNHIFSSFRVTKYRRIPSREIIPTSRPPETTGS